MAAMRRAIQKIRDSMPGVDLDMIKRVTMESQAEDEGYLGEELEGYKTRMIEKQTGQPTL